MTPQAPQAGQETGTPSPRITVNEILDRYERDVVPVELAASTQKNYRRHLVVLRQVFGSRVADELRPKDFGPFLDVRGRGRVQRVRQLAVLSAAFTHAVSSWYLLERNVLRDVKRPKSKPRDRLILDHEFEAVRAFASVRLGLAMKLALITGQRQGDIISFRWSDITDIPPSELTDDGITMEWTVCQSKSGKRIGIGITKDLEAVLDRCWLLPKRDKYVIGRRDGERYTSDGFRAMYQRTMRRAVKRGVLATRFTFHDIRALCATKQKTPEAARRLLGHSNISMTLRAYRRGVERVRALQLSHEITQRPGE